MAQKNIFQCFRSSSKKHAREKTSEKIQPKPNFKRQFMSILLIDFDWCHLIDFDWCHMHPQC